MDRRLAWWFDNLGWSWPFSNQYETTIHYFEIAIVTWNRRMTALNRESSFPQIEDNFYILFLSFKKTVLVLFYIHSCLKN